MPSPFPGMNPYLEQDDAWEDFHHSFITHARDSLSGRIGANYVVKIEVLFYRHELPADERRYAALEIRDRRSRRLVTAVELLSPTNKRHWPDRDEYLLKRGQLL